MKNVTQILKHIGLLSIVALSATATFAQTDSLIFSNGEMVIGEIKKMDRGVVTIETAYSDSDFNIEWDQVSWVRSSQNHLISLSDGRRINASINSTANDNEIRLDDGTNPILIHVQEIVAFKPINDTFWDKFSASIDINLDLTKANNLTQFSTRTNVGYLTKRWELKGNYNTVFSRQDSVADISRMDANVTFNYFLPSDWYVFYSNDFLQNDEQKLALRSTSKLGVGYYLVRTNATYFGLFGGAAANAESFTENSSPDRQSGEAFIGLELNLFDIGDLSLLTSATGFPSLTEDGRFRLDFKFDLKYDLPLDFYIKTGTTINYDNQPVAGAGDLDYVIQTGIGWEW
jgi:hypothetical protein